MHRHLASAAILLVAACAAEPVQAPGGLVLEVIRGPGEVAVPGQRFDTIAVQLRRADGSPAPFEPVTWSGDGIVSPFDGITDGQGIARAGWVLPRTASSPYPSGPSGEFTLTAASPRGGVVLLRTTARAFMVSESDASNSYACGVRVGELWCWGTAGAPGGSVRPVRVDLPLARGPAVALGGAGEGYAFNGGHLLGWHGGQPRTLGPSFAEHNVTAVAGGSQLCVRAASGEVYCSWILLHGGGDTSPYPAELVPVPDPASAGGEG